MAAVRQPAVRAVRALSRQVAHSRAARLIPERVVWSLRRRLLPLRSVDVLEVVGVLADAGVPAWLTGGWGVDALLGRQTRKHADLDLAFDVREDAERRACHALRRLGFQLKEDRAMDEVWVSRRLRLQDGAGRIVELLLIDIAILAAEARNLVSSPGSGTMGGAAGAFTQGVIDGKPIGCLSPAAQLALHLGYRPYGTQRQDVRRLCHRFHLPVPEPYRRASLGLARPP
jgi:lincosamide nucleotidyltransferase A/C/D/E